LTAPGGGGWGRGAKKKTLQIAKSKKERMKGHIKPVAKISCRSTRTPKISKAKRALGRGH